MYNKIFHFRTTFDFRFYIAVVQKRLCNISTTGSGYSKQEQGAQSKVFSIKNLKEQTETY